MAKKKKKIGEQEALPPPPQQTFTDSEIQMVADFVNFIHKEAVFNLSFAGFGKLQKHFINMKKHIETMEAHIFDDIRTRKAPK